MTHASARSDVAAARSEYLRAVLAVHGARWRNPTEEVTHFLGRNKSLWDAIDDGWDHLPDRTSVPSPVQVFAWL
jgi:hypothetical protein